MEKMNTCKLITMVLILAVFSPSMLVGGEICLTFERLPFMEPLVYWTPRELSQRILQELEKRNIESIGFVQEEKLLDRPSSGVVLLDWARAGHLLGNNTFSYVDFNELETKEFLEHVADGQKSILRASRVSGKNFRYLRFPSMHVGDSESKRDKVSDTLYKNNYVVFPATAIPYDYEFNWVFRDYVDNLEALELLREMYVEYIMECMDYAEKQAERVFSREIPQVIRLHIGIATSQFLPSLLDALEARGYTYISPEEILKNPVWKTEENYTGGLALSFVDRVAATRDIQFTPEFWKIDRRDIREAIAAKLEAAEAGPELQQSGESP